MNLNRIKKNIINRNWVGNKKDTNYLKQKLNQFGLPIPKYIKNGKLNQKQIEIQTNKLLKAIDKQQDILRAEANNFTFDKAMVKLQKTAEKHNKLVYKKLGYLVNKYNMSENQLNYMLGREVTLDTYKQKDKFSFSRTNSQFQIIDTENFYASDINSIKERIKQINKFNERLKNTNIDKEVKQSSLAKKQIEQLLKEYVNEGYLSENEYNNILSRFNSLNGIQQEFFYKMGTSSNVKQKYNVSKDEKESFELNLKNKWNTMLNKAKEF